MDRKLLTTLAAIAFAPALACDVPPEVEEAQDEAVSARSSGLLAGNQVAVGLEACDKFVVGLSTPEDVRRVYGKPLVYGRSASGRSSMLYWRNDPGTEVPDMVYFIFDYGGWYSPPRLAGAIRTISAGPYGFTCFRDQRGNTVAPIGLTP
jgi:hypothetical protein